MRYNGYAFTTDVDLVYMSWNEFSRCFVCGDMYIDAIVGLDWIGSFQASISLLYRECYVAKAGTLNTVDGQLGSDSMHCAQPGRPDDVCQMICYLLGSLNESSFTMPDHLLFECAEAHGIDCSSNGIFACSILISHIIFSCDSGGKGSLCMDLCHDGSCSAEQLLYVLSQCVIASEIQFLDTHL